MGSSHRVRDLAAEVDDMGQTIQIPSWVREFLADVVDARLEAGPEYGREKKPADVTSVRIVHCMLVEDPTPSNGDDGYYHLHESDPEIGPDKDNGGWLHSQPPRTIPVRHRCRIFFSPEPLVAAWAEFELRNGHLTQVGQIGITNGADRSAQARRRSDLSVRRLEKELRESLLQDSQGADLLPAPSQGLAAWVKNSLANGQPDHFDPVPLLTDWAPPRTKGVQHAGGRRSSTSADDVIGFVIDWLEVLRSPRPAGGYRKAVAEKNHYSTGWVDKMLRRASPQFIENKRGQGVAGWVTTPTGDRAIADYLAARAE